MIWLLLTLLLVVVLAGRLLVSIAEDTADAEVAWRLVNREQR